MPEGEVRGGFGVRVAVNNSTTRIDRQRKGRLVFAYVLLMLSLAQTAHYSASLWLWSIASAKRATTRANSWLGLAGFWV